MFLIIATLLVPQAHAEDPSPTTREADPTGQGELEAEQENAEAKPKRGSREKLEALWEEYQPYAFNFYPYEPMYFGAGVEPEESKYQVSFRYQFIKDDGQFALDYPWATGFNLAYTQTSFWDLDGKSEPFKDTSYRPEIFYQSPFVLFGPKWARGFRVQSGYRHESNGRGGDESRSTNHLYARLNWIFDLGKDYAIIVSPEAYVYVNNDNDTNAALDEYRGHFDFELTVGDKDGFALSTQYRHGSKGWAVQSDFTYPLHRLFNENLELYFLVQRFDGFGESLLEFREKTHSTRIGLALIR